MDVAYSVSAARVSTGIASLSSMLFTNAVESPPSRNAPMSAVPSDAPRFCAVPWSPPAWFVCDASTEDMITLPTCDASSPTPMPNSASATANWMDASSTSIVASSPSDPIARNTKPRRATAFGERRAAARGPRSAATNIVTDIGSSLTPVSNAS